MITSLYIGILALLYLYISWAVIKQRRKHQISTGFGPNNEIRDIVSAHANFAAYVPIQLILLYCLDSSTYIPAIFIHILGIVIVLGRYLHFLAFSGDKMNFKYRIYGMQMTLFPLLIMGIAAIYIYIRSII